MAFGKLGSRALLEGLCVVWETAMDERLWLGWTRAHALQKIVPDAPRQIVFLAQLYLASYAAAQAALGAPLPLFLRC